MARLHVVCKGVIRQLLLKAFCFLLKPTPSRPYQPIGKPPLPTAGAG